MLRHFGWKGYLLVAFWKVSIWKGYFLVAFWKEAEGIKADIIRLPYTLCHILNHSNGFLSQIDAKSRLAK